MKTLRIRNTKGRAGRRGAALLYAAIIAIAMGGMCIALLGMNMSTTKVRVQTQNSERAFYAAEAGLSDAFMQMDESLIAPPGTTPVTIGTPGAPVALGTSSYSVVISRIDSRSYSLASTGVDGRASERLELVMSEKPTGFFQYAAFGSDGVLLNSNAFIDSYDSALGTYDSQVQGGNDFARENGTVGSNGDIRLRANTEVHGDVVPGPGHVVDDSASNVYISGSTEPADEPFPMPPIEVPSFPSAGNMVGNSTVTLGPGPIHYSSIRMMGGSTLRIVGPAQFVVDDFTMRSNTNLILDSTNGKIEVYGTGNFVLESNSTVTTLSNSAVDVALLLSGNNQAPGGTNRITLSSNADFIGAIYAPNAAFRLGSNFDIYGSIICDYLDLASYGEIHFDEALLYDGWGSTDDYEPALWHRLPRE